MHLVCDGLSCLQMLIAHDLCSLVNFQALCPNCHALKTTRENILYAEAQEERKTRKSRFFNPMCISYLVDPEFDKYFLQQHVFRPNQKFRVCV
jgi:hypothetical protein